MPETTQSYALKLAYDGARFHGFAKQKDAHIATVQGALEEALATVLRLDSPLKTVCAGRTDAGVHALGQVVSFELPGEPLDAQARGSLVRSLNALTPESMSVRWLQAAKPGFSARFDAQSREYHYHLYNHPVPPVFTKDFAWHYPQLLDKFVMKQSIILLQGQHDFRSFCTAASALPGKNTLRTIHTFELFEHDIMGEDILTLRIIGNAFLHSQVRIMVGTVCEIAAGKREYSDLADILAAKNRAAAGITAPAHGLTLRQVIYPEKAIIEDC